MPFPACAGSQDVLTIRFQSIRGIALGQVSPLKRSCDRDASRLGDTPRCGQRAGLARAWLAHRHIGLDIAARPASTVRHRARGHPYGCVPGAVSRRVSREGTGALAGANFDGASVHEGRAHRVRDRVPAAMDDCGAAASVHHASRYLREAIDGHGCKRPLRLDSTGASARCGLRDWMANGRDPTRVTPSANSMIHAPGLSGHGRVNSQSGNSGKVFRRP